MEVLYAKLHDKYAKLKDRKISELDNQFQDQEEKFMEYVKTAERLVEGLRSENEILRSSCYEYERLLAEEQRVLTDEREKTKVLIKEVERLQALQKERDITLIEEHIDNTRTRKQNTDIVHFSSPGDTGASSEGGIIIPPRRSPHSQSAVAQPHKIHQSDLPDTFTEINSQGGPLPDDDQDHQQPSCTVENPSSAGKCRSANFMLLTVMESLTDLKFSIVNEAEKTFLSAVHQASGYSFRLSFTNEEEKTDLFYEVLSLGTIGRLALDWMKEDISLGLNMFPLFMYRLSEALHLQSCRMVR